jgi:hypothetical protein
MRELRVRGPISFGPEKALITSQLLRSDRNISSRVEGSQAGRASFGWELAWGAEFDLILEAAFMNTFTTIDQTGLTVAVDGTAKTFTRTGGSYITDGVLVGHLFHPKGHTNAGNNGYFRVTNVTATVVTVADPKSELVTEGSAAGREYHIKSLRNGTTKKSLLVENGFLDIAQFIQVRGARVGQMDWSMTTGEIVNGTFALMGERMTRAGATVSGSITAHSGTTPVNATANVARLTRNGVLLATAIREWTLSLNNNLRPIQAIGNKYALGINLGSANVSGGMQVHFEDATFLDDVLNHASVGIESLWSDENGNRTGLYVPAVRLASNVDSQGLDSDVLLPVTWEAEAGVNPYTIQIDRVAP